MHVAAHAELRCRERHSDAGQEGGRASVMSSFTCASALETLIARVGPRDIPSGFPHHPAGEIPDRSTS